MNKYLAPILATGVVLGACSPEAPKPETTLTIENLEASRKFETVRPGQSVFLYPETDEMIKNEIKNELRNVNYRYPRGFTDEDAPIVDEVPIRVESFISLNSKGRLSNDIACDSINIDFEAFPDSAAYSIGALALSDSEDDLVQVNWSLDRDNQPADTIQICFDDGNESVDGVVLVLSNK